jgi:hypothetical protein
VQKFGLFLPKFSQKQKELGDFPKTFAKNVIFCVMLARAIYLLTQAYLSIHVVYSLVCRKRGGGG